MLTGFGIKLLTETTDPDVVAVFRLAISEAAHAPRLAQALESIARKPTHDALREIMANARSARLLAGDPDTMAEKFAGLLWGDLMTGLMLEVADRPTASEIARRGGRIAADLSSAWLERLYKLLLRPLTAPKRPTRGLIVLMNHVR